MHLTHLVLVLAWACGAAEQGNVPTKTPAAKVEQPELPSYFSGRGPAKTEQSELPSYYTGDDLKKWPDPIGTEGYWATPSADPAKDAANHGVYDSILQRLEAKRFTSSVRSCLSTLFWAIGISMLIAGMAQPRSGSSTWLMALAMLPLACISFWAFGFAIGFGNCFNGPVPPGWYSSLGPGASVLDKGITFDACPSNPSLLKYGIMGTTGFFFDGFGDSDLLSLFCLMLYQFYVAITLAAGALAERWNWKSLCVFGLWVALPYGLAVNWTWAGGWLAQIGLNWGAGHGVVDYAGLPYALGGSIALAGCLVLGPRPGKIVEGKPTPMPRRSIALAIVAISFLITANGIPGLFAPTPARNIDEASAIVALNTLPATASAAGLVALGMLVRRRRFDLAKVGFGVLSGYAAISVAGPFVNQIATVVTGAIAGLIFIWTDSVLERKGIDDVICAISAYGASALWGMVALGLFADGTRGHGWNGVVRERFVKASGTDGVRGLFYGDTSQLAAQLFGAVVVAAVGFGLSFLMFRLARRIAPARVATSVEEPASGTSADASSASIDASPS